MAMDYLVECIGREDNRAVANEAAFQLSELAYTLRGPLLDLPPVASTNPWQEVKDGDPRLLMVFQDHYSYRPPKGKRKNNLVIGPGYKLALIVPNAEDPRHGRPQAIFAWRLERYRHDRDYGANCAFFRNESRLPASDLILAAEEHAHLRWPYIPRFFTYIDTAKVKPTWRRGVPSLGLQLRQGRLGQCCRSAPPAACCAWRKPSCRWAGWTPGQPAQQSQPALSATKGPTGHFLCATANGIHAPARSRPGVLMDLDPGQPILRYLLRNRILASLRLDDHVSELKEPAFVAARPVRKCQPPEIQKSPQGSPAFHASLLAFTPLPTGP